MPRSDGLPEWLRRSMQVGGAALLMIGGPVAYCLDGAAAAGVFLGAGAAALILSLLDRVEQFAAFGLSAKLREAQAAASEAVASAAQVRSLALSLVRLALALAKGGGRMDGGQRNQRTTRAEALQILEALGATPEERRQAFEIWTAVALHDHASAVSSAIRQAVKLEDHPQVDAWREEIGQAFVAGQPPPFASAMRQRAAAFAVLTDGAVEAALARLAQAEARVASGGSLDAAQA